MKRVLVVDDDQVFRAIICDSLKERGYATEEASDGAAAAKAIKAGNFDLVVSDIMMPQMTGIELLKWVSDKKLAIPIILLTGFSELYEMSEALQLGAAAFLPKPFRRDELLGAIKTALSSQEEIPSTTDLDDGFCKISIEDFVCGSMININIYVRLSEKKYVKIAHTGQDITTEQIAVYKEKGLSYLHVTKDDFKTYIGLGSKLSTAISKNSEISKARKLNFLRHSAEIITQHFFCNEIDGEVMSHAKNIVETSVSLLADNPDAFKLLESLNQESDYTYAHSVGVSFHAALIGKRLKWLSPLTLYKISLAGLLHDIGKKEIPKEVLNKPRHELSQTEISLLETHTSRGMEILNQLKDIPSDVIQVALQHHENAIGTGYPYRLKANKTHPLARVIAVADEFCYLALPSLTGKGLPAKEALEKLVTFHTEKLDAEALHALFLIYGVTPPVDMLERSKKLQSKMRVA
jgi:putative nucleotidyltransferase with HDIG domain